MIRTFVMNGSVEVDDGAPDNESKARGLADRGLHIVNGNYAAEGDSFIRKHHSSSHLRLRWAEGLRIIISAQQAGDRALSPTSCSRIADKSFRKFSNNVLGRLDWKCHAKA
jgi:hypothetical protein